MSKRELMEQVAPDKDTILSYIKTFGNCGGRHGIDNILAPWAKNKGRLWRLLGRQMMVEVPVSLEKGTQLILDGLADLYSFDREEGDVWLSPERQKNAFVREYTQFLIEQELNCGIEFDLTQSLLNGYTLLRDEVIFRQGKKVVLEVNGKKLTFQNGMRPVRALSKVVNFFGVEHFPHWEEFRLAHSNILTGKKTEGTLVLSIHPLDFMTMSDNDNGWQSCMSWSQDGCYSQGTLEMMNSNNVLIAYIRSKNDWTFNKKTGDKWNNKSWRTLVVVDKDLIVAGKAYPHQNDELAKAVVRAIEGLAEQNFGWTYQYGVQPYWDMLSVWNNFTVRERKNPEKKNILLWTKLMYNDIMEDSETEYWCVRNRVQKQKILCISGQTYCLDCGRPYSFEDGDDGTSMHICYSCYDKYSCGDCGRYVLPGEYHEVDGVMYCDQCYENLRVCPDCGTPDQHHQRFVVFHTQEELDRVERGDYDRAPYAFYWAEFSGELDGTEVSVCPRCYDQLLADHQLKRLNNSMVRYLLTPYPKNSDYVRKHIWGNWARYAERELVKEAITTVTTTISNGTTYIWGQLTNAVQGAGLTLSSFSQSLRGTSSDEATGS